MRHYSPLIGEPWACRRLLPRFDELSPDCKGVILSIAFNRDAGGFNKPGTRWTEMRQIKAAIGLA